MEKLTQFIEEKIAPPLIKFSQLKYVQVMQRTGLGIMSLLVIGSVFLLIASFPVKAWTDFLGDKRWVIAAASGVGTGFIALYTVITTSYGLVEYYNKQRGENHDIVQPMILAVASFLLLNPAQTVTTMVDGVEGKFTGVPSTYMGALGVFAALIVAIITVEIYRFVVNKKLVIKMPEGVPPMVSQSFIALIPSFFVILFWWLLGHVFQLNIPELIAGVFKPLVAVGDSPIVVMIATLLNRILWAVGIHGSNIVNYNKQRGENHDIVQPMILAVASFLLLNPAQTVTTMVDGVEGKFTGVPSTYMGALGVFAALIVAIITVEIYRFVVNKKLVIKMPEGVPPMVSQSFIALIPSFFVILFWWLLGHVFQLNIPELIAGVFKPLVAVGDSPIVVMIATLLNRILWAVGIHGSNIVNSVGGTFWGQMSQLNLAAFEATGTLANLPHTYTSVFMDNYIWTGLFPLSLCLIMSKSPRLSGLGKLALAASLFNIGEPLIFGLPIMLNPLMMIPFILSYLVLALAAIVLTTLGVIPVPALMISWITPAPIKTYLATAGSIPATAFVLVGWVFMFLCFYPFVKAMEKNDLAEMAAAEQAEEN
ncbi:PTS transporter subunit EIIC [Erysipelothrix rhusiopathiae]|nr:PTS transporter subunit EIIC [Erysipelothrix rhusiopathiae]